MRWSWLSSPPVALLGLLAAVIAVCQWLVSLARFLLAKGLIDKAAAVLTLALVAPTLLAIATAIKLEDGGPVLSKHVRIGRNGKPFRLYKFRTVTPGPDQRITRIGAILRRWWIDELPILFSVVRGRMSLIGPHS